MVFFPLTNGRPNLDGGQGVHERGIHAQFHLHAGTFNRRGCLNSAMAATRGLLVSSLLCVLVSAPCTTAQMPRNVEGPAPTPTEGPIVLEYGPTGALDTLFPTLKVRFDRQMVTPGPLGTRDAGPAFEITPSIDERARWVGTDLVELRVLTRLPLATTFTVTFTLPEELAGAATPLRWTFSTPPPTCSFFDPRLPGSVLAQDEPLLIECTAPVDLGGLKRWVKVLADGRGFPAEVALLSELAQPDAGPPSRLAELAHMLAGERVESIIVVRPRTAWPEVRRLSVLLSPDLRSREGPLVMGRPVELVAQDIPPFQVQQARCTEHGRAVEIMFSTPVPQRQLELLTVAPALEPLSLLRHAELDPTGKSASWVYRLGMGRGSTDYTITLPARLQDEYGQSLPAIVGRNVHCPSSVFLEFEHWGGLLEPGKPRTVELSFRDIQQAQVRAVSMSAEQILLQAPKFAFEWKWGRLDKDADWRALGNHGLPLEAAGLPVVVGNIDLAGSRQGTSAPDPIWSDALDLDKYLRSGDRALWVELSAAGQVQTRALFQVTNLGLLAWASAGPGLVQAVRLSDGAALSGVALWLAGSDGVRTDLGRTDAAGLLRIPTDEKCHDDRSLLARTPDGRWPGMLEYTQMVGCEDEREPSLLHPGEELVGHLRTERDLYAPGDTIHFVGWAAISAPRDASGFRSVPVGASVRIELEKDRRTVIETKAVVDEHGKFWAICPFRRTRDRHGTNCTLMWTFAIRPVGMEQTSTTSTASSCGLPASAPVICLWICAWSQPTPLLARPCRLICVPFIAVAEAQPCPGPRPTWPVANGAQSVESGPPTRTFIIPARRFRSASWTAGWRSVIFAWRLLRHSHHSSRRWPAPCRCTSTTRARASRPPRPSCTYILRTTICRPRPSPPS